MDQELSDILDDDYLADLGTMDVAEIRQRRAQCQDVENALSYLRRLAQGRLDIVAVQLERRASGGDPADLESLVARLPTVLSDRTRGPGSGHLPRVLAPGRVDGALAEELAGMEVEAHLTNLPEVSDDWLRSIQARLLDFEHDVSGTRRQLFGRIDALQEELSRRYRSGEVTVDTVIAEG